MKVLPENNISTVSAVAARVPYDLQNVDAENILDSSSDQLQALGHSALVDPEFPASNVLNSQPKSLCKVQHYSARFDVHVDGPGNALLMGYTTAKTAYIYIYDVNGDFIQKSVLSLGGISPYTKLITDTRTALTCIGVDYPYQYTAHDIVVILETNNENVDVELGLMQAGVVLMSKHDTTAGLKEGLKDYSFSKELTNGSFYYKKRDIVRTFDGSILTCSASEFSMFMKDIAQKNGQTPLFWDITDINSDNWLVFGRFVTMPSGTHEAVKYTNLNFQIIEVL